MKDQDKTKDQLIEELDELRQRVTELEKAAMERDYAQEEWSVLFDALESSVNAVLITNLEGRIIYVNLAFLSMFEYGEKSELLGRNAADLFDSEQIIRFADVKAVIDKAKGETEEFTVRRKDGTTFPVEISSSSVTDREGNIIGRMASFVDITERKLAQERLEAEKLRAVLETAGAVCHEFSQPMQVISMCCELLIKELSENDRLSGHLGKIQIRIEEMVGLLAKLARITKYETKHYPGNVEIIDIDKAART